MKFNFLFCLAIFFFFSCEEKEEHSLNDKTERLYTINDNFECNNDIINIFKVQTGEADDVDAECENFVNCIIKLNESGMINYVFDSFDPQKRLSFYVKKNHEEVEFYIHDKDYKLSHDATLLNRAMTVCYGYYNLFRIIPEKVFYEYIKKNLNNKTREGEYINYVFPYMNINSETSLFFVRELPGSNIVRIVVHDRNNDVKTDERCIIDIECDIENKELNNNLYNLLSLFHDSPISPTPENWKHLNQKYITEPIKVNIDNKIFKLETFN